MKPKHISYSDFNLWGRITEKVISLEYQVIDVNLRRNLENKLSTTLRLSLPENYEVLQRCFKDLSNEK